MSTQTLLPLRIVDGPDTYIFTYVRDLENNILIDRIYKFEDGGSRHGTPVAFSSLPDTVRHRYYRLVE